MHQTYIHILTFLFKHSFFSDGFFKSIEFSFEENTAKLMRDLGIVIKPFAGGGHLLTSDTELLKSFTETNPLRLKLTCKDPYYINYTNLPNYNPANNILYFNNLSELSNHGTNSYFLHKNDNVGNDEVVQISSGSINIPSFDAQKEYRFTDALENDIPPQNFVQTSAKPGNLGITNLSQGMVYIKSEQEEIGRYYYQPKTVWQKPLGILEIYTNKLFGHYSNNGKAEYIVNFSNRKTIWKYFFVGQNYQKLSNLRIINKGEEQIFKAPEKQQINESFDAWVFESKNKLPLAEYFNDTLQLFNNYNFNLKKGDLIIKNLPAPSASQLYTDATNSNDAIYSHIYI